LRPERYYHLTSNRHSGEHTSHIKTVFFLYQPLSWTSAFLLAVHRLCGVIVPFSATLAQDVLAECDQPGKIPLKFSAVESKPWNRSRGIEPGPRGGQTVSYPTELSWLTQKHSYITLILHEIQMQWSRYALFPIYILSLMHNISHYCTQRFLSMVACMLHYVRDFWWFLNKTTAVCWNYVSKFLRVLHGKTRSSERKRSTSWQAPLRRRLGDNTEGSKDITRTVASKTHVALRRSRQTWSIHHTKEEHFDTHHNNFRLDCIQPNF